MRTLRLLAAGSLFAFSLVTIGFVCADRLAHPVWVPPSAPLPVMARAPARDPGTTGSVPVAPKPAAPKPKAIDGFDTERLNALMRGDPISGPTRRN